MSLILLDLRASVTIALSEFVRVFIQLFRAPRKIETPGSLRQSTKAVLKYLAH